MREEVEELHYICPTTNVPSIMSQGIVSHRAAKQLDHHSVADPTIQDRRSVARVPGGLRLHDYVNLYFNGRNPMMFTVVGSNGVDLMCLLRVSPNVLDLPGVVITDCNASSDYVRFSDSATGLGRIDSDEVFARYWTHADYYAQLRHKSRMCAEVLVPDVVDSSYVLGAYVASDAAAQSLQADTPSLSVSTDKYKFFR